MEPSTEQLRKNYQALSDNKLISLATEEAEKLRPEALEILKEIIKERGLSENVLKGLDARIHLTDELFNEYLSIIRDLPCPICNAQNKKLNATVTGKVISIVILTTYSKKFKIACPNCLTEAHRSAVLQTAIFGWWCIPWGIVRTIEALIFNNKMKKQCVLPDSNETMRAFVFKNVEKIEMNKNNQLELRAMIVIEE